VIDFVKQTLSNNITKVCCLHCQMKYHLGRFHRPGLTLQLANPRLRDNRGLSPVCIPLLSVNLTVHLTCDLASFRYAASVIGCRGHVSTRSGHIIIIFIAAHSISAMALAMLSYSWCDRKGFSNFNGLQFGNDR